MTFKFGRRALVAGAVAALSFGAPAFADGHKVLDSIHFLIPGGAGGGWDGTARGTDIPRILHALLVVEEERY